MREKCTWVDCTAAATKAQIAADGEQWAHLCETHFLELDTAMKAGVKPMLSAWVKAQGGTKAAAKRMT